MKDEKYYVIARAGFDTSQRARARLLNHQPEAMTWFGFTNPSQWEQSLWVRRQVSVRDDRGIGQAVKELRGGRCEGRGHNRLQ
jgi:hypothetical protein